MNRETNALLAQVTALQYRVKQLETAIICAKNGIDSMESDVDAAMGILIDALPDYDWPHSEMRATEARHVYCPTCNDYVTWWSIDGGPPMLIGYPLGVDPLEGWGAEGPDGERLCPKHKGYQT